MAEKLVPYYQVTDDGVRIHIPKPTTVGHVLKVVSLSPLAFQFGAASGGGSGDFVGPSSSTDLSIIQFDGTSGKLGKVAPVKITGAGAMVPDADGTQQLGNHSFTWTELWAMQVTNKVQASAQAPSPGWSTSYAAFWTKTGGLPQHTYNGTDRQLALAGANSDITSLSALSTPLSVAQGGTNATTAAGARSSLGAAASGANSDITSLSALSTSLSIGQGGTGQTTAAGAFGALKQDATTSASGVVEIGTWAESQGTSTRVDASNAYWLIYDPRRPLWGRFSHLVFKNAVTGFGVWDAPTVTGTFTPTSQVSGTYGGWRRVTCTTTARGWYAGNTSSILTWDLAPYVRCRFWLGTSDTTSVGKCFGALATVTTGPAEVIAAESAVTRCVRFGIDGGAFKAYNADGAARTTTSFTATPSNNVMYCFEIVMLRSGNIKFNLYSWTLDAGLTLVESQTSTTNVPTGSTALWTGYWCAAASGTPTVMFGDAECVLNLE